MKDRLNEIAHVALDLDGTVYRGRTMFETSLPFLELLTRLGVGYTFLTNNPSKNTAEYLKHLAALGIRISAEQLYTSTQATVEFLAEQRPRLRRLFILGTAGMAAEFAAAGYGLAEDDPADEPDAVVVGFDLTLTHARLCRAAWWISRGKEYFATNPDRVCPTDEATVLVDCGSIVAALQAATGVSPAAVMGKPDPGMIRGILRRHGLEPGQLAMVGDRLSTDIAMARRSGALGVLVLTGEATAAQAAAADPAPDLVVADLAELGARFQSRRGVKAPA